MTKFRDESLEFAACLAGGSGMSGYVLVQMPLQVRARLWKPGNDSDPMRQLCFFLGPDFLSGRSIKFAKRAPVALTANPPIEIGA